MSFRALNVAVYDALRLDVCLPGLLDEDDRMVTHGRDFCDQPPFTDQGLPIRRSEQPWDSDFTRAIVTFGQFSRSPVAPELARWEEQWVFRVGIYAQKTVTSWTGAAVQGDLHVGDIYDQVVRILGWAGPSCPTEGVRVLRVDHDGDVTPIFFDAADKGVWTLVTQFRWIAVSRGLRAGVPNCC